MAFEKDVGFVTNISQIFFFFLKLNRSQFESCAHLDEQDTRDLTLVKVWKGAPTAHRLQPFSSLNISYRLLKRILDPSVDDAISKLEAKRKVIITSAFLIVRLSFISACLWLAVYKNPAIGFNVWSTTNDHQLSIVWHLKSERRLTTVYLYIGGSLKP